MPWVKLDDGFPLNPKVLAAGEDAAWLYICGLCYCGQQLTNGLIPCSVVARLVQKRRPLDLALKLVSCGLWEQNEAGDYVVHDYLQWNLAADDVKQRRATTSARVSAWREKKKAASGNAVGNAVTTSVTPAPVTPSQARSCNAPVTLPEGEGEGEGEVVLKATASGAGGLTAPLALALSDPPPPKRPDLGTAQNGKQRAVVDAHVDDALAVLAALNAARHRVKSTCRGIRPTYVSLYGIAQVVALHGVESALHIVAVRESECRREPSSLEWFDAVTPWRPENAERALARDLPAALSTKRTGTDDASLRSFYGSDEEST